MFIRLGIINYKLIIPLLYPIFYQVRFGISNTDNDCFELFINFLSYTLAGIVFLIVRYNTNNSKQENTTPNQDSSTKPSEDKIVIDVYNDDVRSNKIIKKYNKTKLEKEKIELCNLKIFVISLALINLIPMMAEIMAHNSFKDILDFNINEISSFVSEIFFYILFSRIYLDHKIYKHQILALVIMSLCMVCIFSSYLIENSFELGRFISIIFFSLIFGIYALYNVLGKILFDSFIISPYYFMFTIGLISLIILLPYEIITCIIFGPDWNYNGIIRQIKNNFSFVFLLRSIGSVLAGFFWLCGIWLTVYFFTPCHIIISESLSQFITTLISRYKEYSTAAKIICYISYGFIIFSSLIYNEIIIINNASISRDTKIFIIERQSGELGLIENNQKKVDVSYMSDQ